MEATDLEFSSRSACLWILAWPYYRSLHHRTLLPMRRIARSSTVGELATHLDRWVTDKERELSFVNVAGTVSAALTATVFSWPSVPDSLWYVRGLWYSSLILAVMALVASTQEDTLLEEMRRARLGSSSAFHSDCICSPCYVAERVRNRNKQNEANPKKVSSMTEPDFVSILPLFLRLDYLRGAEFSVVDVESTMPFTENNVVASNLMIFVWQCPLMLMSYSWASFVGALTLYLMQPFINQKAWNDDSKIAVMYLVVWGFCLLAFVGSAAWPRIQSQRYHPTILRARSLPS